MAYPPSAYELHQRKRWLRHDMHLWIRHDAARWVKPGTDPADVFPTLKRDRAQKEAARERARAAEDAAFEAAIEDARRVQAALRAEVDELKAAQARRRLEEAKYSPSQPRVPAGNPRGGQWTDRSGGRSQGQSEGIGLAQPMGNVELGDVSGSSELGDLFQIKPDDTSPNGEQVADVIRVCTVAGAGRATVDGVKTHFVIYECFGGRTFRVDGTGHNFPGVVLDRFR
ncbi:MAG: hypothetical protein QOI05_1517 [Bradyrhizobium sp.]|jgi:hypothetical protein|nr:hypothetical protein [Bradyrhizobium sp.]